jgi:hypothetical protein
MKNSILLLLCFPYYQTPYLVKVQNGNRQKYLSDYFQNDARRKIGQMTQITVTNFEEKTNLVSLIC